jgi:hypothetical protein
VALDCSLYAKITVFRKSSYLYFPSKPDDLSRSTHLHKPRRIARRRCGAQFPLQPWKIVPTPPQIYHTARIPLISVTSVISMISVTLQIPHKHLHILTTSHAAQKRSCWLVSWVHSTNTSSLPCLECYGKYWFVRFQLTQDPGCSWLRRHLMLFLRPKG